MTQEEFFKRYQYSIREDKIGGGAFGAVYKAYDTLLDRTVAIKVSEVKVINGKEFSLMEEYNAVKNLPTHQNIANYEGVFTFEGPHGIFDYAVIQYYPDGNLKDAIELYNIDSEQREDILLQLLDGIDFLHQHNVLHRDLKPSNILVHKRQTQQEEKYIIKIADFGLSKVANPNEQSRITNSFGGGTLAYSSPEQLKGEELRFNADLWSYGVIVYEVLSGKALFSQTSMGSSSLDDNKVIQNILNKNTGSLLASLPTKWQTVVRACLERDAEKRLKNTQEICKLLETKISIEPITETVLLEKKIPEIVIIDIPETVISATETSLPKKKNNLKLWLGSVAVLLFISIGIFSLNNSKNLPGITNKNNKTENPVSVIYPKPLGYVSDFEKTLSKEEVETLEKILRDYEQESTNQIFIVSISDNVTEDNFNQYALDLANNWGIGTAEKNNGLAIIYSDKLKNMRICTGIGTEKIITDEICRQVMDYIIMPQFKTDDYFSGLKNGVNAFIEAWKSKN